MTRYIPHILFALGLLALSLIQSGFVPALGRQFDLVALPMFFVLFAVSVFDERLALAMVAFAFLITTVLSGTFVLSTLIIAIANTMFLSELHARFFTNRTYYSVLIVAAVGWLTFIVVQYGFVNVWEFFRTAGESSLLTPTLTAFTVSIASLWMFISLAYLATVMLSKRIRSYFIVTER